MTQGRPAERPRLLVLASTYPRWPGDPEPGFVHELAKRLVADFEVHVLGPHAAGAATEEVFEGVRVHRFRYAPAACETLVNAGGIVTNLRRARWKWLLVPPFFAAMAWRAWRLTRRERFALVHAHWLVPQGVVAMLLRRLSRGAPGFVVTSHGADLHALRGSLPQSLKRAVARHAAALTVVSSAMIEPMAALGVDRERVAVRPMGVDLVGRFTPDRAVQRTTDELLFVGRLVEKKGLSYLIEAMPAILAARPSAVLTIAGFGPEEEERRRQVARLGLEAHVRFLGAVSQEDLPALYRRAAVFVAPFVQAASGDQEGLGLVAVEAAGCGCPVVVGDVPAVRDIFDQPSLARRVPPGDATALARAVVELLGDPPAASAQAARALDAVRARFDWGSVARQYARVLTDAARP